MRGGPLSWLATDAAALNAGYDLVIATSMVDAVTLRGLCPSLAAIPWITYFHENQFSYPSRAHAQTHAQTQAKTETKVDRQMVQLYSGLCADALAFNSAFNREDYLAGVKKLVAKFPDLVDRSMAEGMAAKAHVLPIPIDWQGLAAPPRQPDGCPRIVFNHRVEYDKGLEEFYGFVSELERQGEGFSLILLGQRFRRMPEAWQKLTTDFAHRIEVDGFITDRGEYLATLARGDVVVSTAWQEFQGLAFLEAIARGCRPLAPRRLVYPEYVGPDGLYEGGAAAMVAAYRRVIALDQRDPDQRECLAGLKPGAVQAMSRSASRRQWQELCARVREPYERRS